MLKGRHIMIDLETLGTSAGAMMLQVGACEFFPEEGRIGNTFNQYVDMGSSLQAGRMFDPGAFLFWLRQSEEARSRLVSGLEDTYSLSSVLMNLTDFIQVSNGRQGLGQRRFEPDGVWSHGSGFDLVIVRENYASLGIKEPYDFRLDRDTRTLFSMAEVKVSGFEEKWPDHVPPFVAHDGLSDAVAQAICVMHALARMEDL